MDIEKPDDALTRQGMRRARILRRIFWVSCLWMAAWLGICLEQAISWTDSMQGLMNGGMTGAFISPFMLIYLIPIGLIGGAIGSLKPLLPYRWWVSLALPLAFCFLPVVSRVRDRIDPGRRFERHTDVRFPKEIRNLKTYCWGGMFADITDTYTFECARGETERLILELKLYPEDKIDSSIMGGPGSGFSPVSSGWSGPVLLRPRGKLVGIDFLEMFVDETRTRVHIIYGTI